MRFPISTAAYRSSHGRAPRGFGAWMFAFDGDAVAVPGGAQHYVTARQWAVMEARRRKVATLAVCP